MVLGRHLSFGYLDPWGKGSCKPLEVSRMPGPYVFPRGSN